MTLLQPTVFARARAPFLLLMFAVFAALALGCATPRPPPPPAIPPPTPAVDLPPLEKALRALAGAESAYGADAARAAIDAVLAIEDPEQPLHLRAEMLWGDLPDAGLGTLADRYRGARLAVAAGNPALALERLGAVDDRSDIELLRNALEAQANLLAGSRRYAEALRARVALDPLLVDDPSGQDANQQAIWRLLASLEPGQANAFATFETDLRLRGWAALFSALRAAGRDEVEVDRALRAWSLEYPGHPGQAQRATLRQTSLRIQAPPRQIAVLLPLSGPLSDLGEALLEGIRLGREYGDFPEEAFVVLDTGGDPELAAAYYHEAIRAGADRVIGPLTREEVERVVSLEPARPTLLLNQPPGTVPPPFSVLSLSPEADARAVAREAIAMGRRQALVLTPEGAFGDRIAQAFRETFSAEDGTIAAEHPFEARSPELNTQIRNALDIDSSMQRVARLARRTGLPLEGDPQVRADIDMIMIAGSARDLRLVVPYLHYFRAGRLPMLATSHVYEGFPQPSLDQDLEGIRFPDAPWLHPDLNPEPDLAESLRASGDVRAATAMRLPRFTALGIDAGRIIGDLPRYASAPHLEVRGTVGTWTFRPEERSWTREPAWFQFREGQPHPLRRDTGDRMPPL